MAPRHKKPNAKDLKQSRESWIDRALEVLASEGIDKVRVESLARQIGVTKGSFYWHFEDRAALHVAMLECWQERQTAAIIVAVEGVGGNARERMAQLRDSTLDRQLAALDMAIRAWANHDDIAAQYLARVDRRRMDYLRKLLSELGFSRVEQEARALLGYSLLMGNYFLDVPHGRYSRPRVLQQCFELLTGGEPNGSRRA